MKRPELEYTPPPRIKRFWGSDFINPCPIWYPFANGWQQWHAGNYEGALHHFQHAGESGDAMTHCGVAALALNRPEDALACFEKALEFPPCDTINTFVFAGQGGSIWTGVRLPIIVHEGVSITVYGFQSIEGPREPWIGAALCEMQLGRYEQAAERMTITLEANPTFIEFRVLLLRALYELKRYEEMIRWSDGYQNRNAASQLILFYRGIAQSELGHYAVACDTLKAAGKNRTRPMENVLSAELSRALILREHGGVKGLYESGEILQRIEAERPGFLAKRGIEQNTPTQRAANGDTNGGSRVTHENGRRKVVYPGRVKG